MSNQIEDFLNLLKRTLQGDPYTYGRGNRVRSHAYTVISIDDPFIGQYLGGKYFILDKIGSGSMSIVYRARQDPISRIVAVKLLRSEWCNDELTVKRFEREARAVSSLRHANIPAIMDIGIADTGQPYFVTELVSGRSLEEILSQSGALEVERAAGIFVQICEAISHAHRHGLIHRDLKPSNVMIVNDSGKEQVKLVDFGIVKYAKAQVASQQLTRKGEIWGSPVYMSPEQCSGTELDFRTDIYSMGTVMYEVLTGKLAFDGKSIPIILSKQLQEMPAEFSVAAPEKVIPKKLEAIVFRALQKQPDKRYQSMDDCKTALDEVLKDFTRAGQNRSNPAAVSIREPRPASSANSLPPQLHKQTAPPVDSLNNRAQGPRQQAEPRHAEGDSNRLQRLLIIIVCLVLVGGGIVAGVLIGLKEAPLPQQDTESK